MWSAIISAVGSMVLGAFKWLYGGKQQAAGEAQGVAEAERDSATSAATVASAVAKAEANAPQTNADVLKLLEEGKA